MTSQKLKQMESLCCRIQTPSIEKFLKLLPEEPLYGHHAEAAISKPGWLLSPIPYMLSQNQLDFLHQLGDALYQFSKAIDRLYKASLVQPNYYWVQKLFDAGKPQHLVTFSRMGRFKQSIPLIIRPDLLVTDKGFALCEIDAVPGGIGFTAALYKMYQSLGFSLIGDLENILHSFINMLISASPFSVSEQPLIAVVVSDEASDYRSEMLWLVDNIRSFYPKITLLHPKNLLMERNQLGFLDKDDNFQSIQIIYRFFELFDLANIPQIELVQYAIKKGIVYCTPPFKPQLEEKFVLALLHNPFLEAFWIEAMGENSFWLLKSVVPEGWILNPEPVPPHASIVPELGFLNKKLQDFRDLALLTQKERRLVVKPSGFSPLAWGSRGVSVGHDLSQKDWQATLDNAFMQFETTPYIMQRFESTSVEPYSYFDPETGEITASEGRTRLCPYYFIIDEKPHLAGILATTCPKDKKIIHGMKDGSLRPACLQNS